MHQYRSNILSILKSLGIQPLVSQLKMSLIKIIHFAMKHIVCSCSFLVELWITTKHDDTLYVVIVNIDISTKAKFVLLLIFLPY